MLNDTTLKSLFDYAKKPCQDPSLPSTCPSVYATLVEHFADLHPTADNTADLVMYAQGRLELSANQKTLSGELKLWRNKHVSGLPPFFGSPATPEDAFADVDGSTTVFISVSDSGQASLQKKLKGKPIGGTLPIPLQATYNSGLFVEQNQGVVRSLSFSLA
jgi:hypothetical protein